MSYIIELTVQKIRIYLPPLTMRHAVDFKKVIVKKTKRQQKPRDH